MSVWRKEGGIILKSRKMYFLSIFLTLILLMNAAFPVFAEQEEKSMQTDTDKSETPLYTEQIIYNDYYDLYIDEKRPESEILIRGEEYTEIDHGSEADGITTGSYGKAYQQEDKENILIWNAPDGRVCYEADIPETGIYCLKFSYMPIPSNMTNIEFSILIDGEVPYDTAARATLNKVYINSEETTFDSKGNQIRPVQIQTGVWRETPLLDVDGLFNDPLIFYLEQGKHEITFEINKGYFALEYFQFYTPEEVPEYTEYQDSIDTDVTIENTPSTLIRIEGEEAVYKSDSTLYPTAENTDYLVSPSNPSKTVYNTIGSGNWKQAMQSITWEIDGDQIQDGWYKLGIKARQKEMRGLYSNRRIYIDEEVICQEMNQVKFYYDTEWQVVTPTDSDDHEVYFYLKGGENHTIRMEVLPGEIGESMRILDSAVMDINLYYRKILMITGSVPDKYTDYYVHERIPELLSEFERLSDNLKAIQKNIETMAGSEGSEAAALERMYIILDYCIETPLKIPDYLSQIKDNLTALSAWMVDYRNQPLEVDYLELASMDREFSSVKRSLWQSLSFGWEKFYSSFFEDYTNLSDDAGEEAINIWVSSGREQAMIVKALAESEFTEQYDTPIAVNLVVGGIVEATLAGKGPDAALFLGGEFPVNLAARGLLADLSEFSDFEEITERFQENATVPYCYENGCYGLPLSQSWAMMFYRKDVLSELGYTAPPSTWEDMIDMLPGLQRNYMYIGLVLPVISGTNATISAATESGHTFAMLMLQNGLNYYNSAQTQTNFQDIRAVQAFKHWTDLYTKYGFEQSYDAFSRFRTGEYPIVIADYSFYNQLCAASPEIKGLWDFTQVPGTVQEDGSISHAVNSSSSGAVIFNKCENIEGAWKFLKWFSSAEVQAEYGRQAEGLLGQMGRYATANTEALQQLAWSKSEQEILLNAQSELQEIPIIPASYAVTRNIMNAFRETVNHHENPRDTLLWYNRDINTEITRKRENLGLSTAKEE